MSDELILAVDTSCDDTAAAVVRGGRDVLSNIVSSQHDVHAQYGGIVPELASRKHMEMLWPVVEEALKHSGTTLSDMNALAVCYGPGLIGSLIVGCSFMKSAAYAAGLPLIAVNHLEGHICSALLSCPQIGYPFLSLVISGGHTSIYKVEAPGRYTELGATRDDAAGEAFDKVARLCSLGYPGGPVIDKLSQSGDSSAIRFPRAMLPGSLDFSFSGLKTSVRTYVEHNAGSYKVENLCASFQAAIADVLIRKMEMAVEKEKPAAIALAGGVAANSTLRAAFKKFGKEMAIEVILPPIAHCTDNAAMIAAQAHHQYVCREFASLDINPVASLQV